MTRAGCIARTFATNNAIYKAYACGCKACATAVSHSKRRDVFNGALKVATTFGDAVVVASLLRDDRVNPVSAAAVHDACCWGSVDVIRAFLACPRVNPNDFMTNMLRHAHIARLLLTDRRVRRAQLQTVIARVLPRPCTWFALVHN